MYVARKPAVSNSFGKAVAPRGGGLDAVSGGVRPIGYTARANEAFAPPLCDQGAPERLRREVELFDQADTDHLPQDLRSGAVPFWVDTFVKASNNTCSAPAAVTLARSGGPFGLNLPGPNVGPCLSLNCNIQGAGHIFHKVLNATGIPGLFNGIMKYVFIGAAVVVGLIVMSIVWK